MAETDFAADASSKRMMSPSSSPHNRVTHQLLGSSTGPLRTALTVPPKARHYRRRHLGSNSVHLAASASASACSLFVIKLLCIAASILRSYQHLQTAATINGETMKRGETHGQHQSRM